MEIEKQQEIFRAELTNLDTKHSEDMLRRQKQWESTRQAESESTQQQYNLLATRQSHENENIRLNL